MNHGISIIVPLYNKEHTIERSLESVFSQNDSRYEVIVVDDGSTDNSYQFVTEKYGSRIRFISQSNGGPSAARNSGAQHAKMKYLLFLDADDELTPDCVGIHLRAFQNYPIASLCITSHQVMDQGKLVSENLVDSSELVLEGEFGCVQGFHPAFVFGRHLPCLSVEKSVFALVNGFDERLRCWEVTDFMFRINLLNKYVAFTNKITIIKNEDLVNSQFTRERKNVRYIEIVSRKMLDRIDDVPVEYRAQTLEPVKRMLKALFSLREFDVCRDIGKQACHHFRTYGVKAGVCLLIRIPVGILQALVRFRGGIDISQS